MTKIKPTCHTKRAYDYQWHYGITYADRDKLYEQQGGCCAICGKDLNHKYDTDHCHTTGRVRGLLCKNCNRGLGFFDDDVERFKTVIRYLQRPSPVEPTPLKRKETTVIVGAACKTCQSTSRYQNGHCIQCAKTRWANRPTVSERCGTV